MPERNKQKNPRHLNSPYTQTAASTANERVQTRPINRALALARARTYTSHARSARARRCRSLVAVIVVVVVVAAAAVAAVVVVAAAAAAVATCLSLCRVGRSVRRSVGSNTCCAIRNQTHAHAKANNALKRAIFFCFTFFLAFCLRLSGCCCANARMLARLLACLLVRQRRRQQRWRRQQQQRRSRLERARASSENQASQ